MAKYKIGNRVRVIACKHGHEFDIGNVVTVLYVGDNKYGASYECLNENGDSWWLSESEITPAEPEPEITVNGAVYILKPEPEHEWKFGDWARDRSGDLGMVISHEHTNGGVWFLRKGDTSGNFITASSLTYISTAEIPA